MEAYSPNAQVKYLFEKWQDEILCAAADAFECCISSAFLNHGAITLLNRLAGRVASMASKLTGSPIKVLVSAKFAADETQKNSILRRIAAMPGVEIRIHDQARFLHQKNYIFKTPEDIRVIIGSVNATAGGFFYNLESAACITHPIDDEAGQAIHRQFSELWQEAKNAKPNDEEDATMPKPLFSVGDNVRIVGESGIATVNKVLESERSIAYKVTADGRIRTIQEKFLERCENEEEAMLDALALHEFGSNDEFRLFQTWIRLKRPIEGNLYTYLGSRTLFNPFQFKPLLKMLGPGSEERLFIADEVGVGKTIETGIIISEMLSRGRINRKSPMLVVCPYALGPKWVKEMQNRFNLPFHLHDGKSLNHGFNQLAQTGYWPEQTIWGVAGLELIRYGERMELLEKLKASRQHPVWSMVVVDEAHHLRNQETESSALGNLLSSLTDMMLMLSATPLNLRDADLFNQMTILNPSLFPDPQTFEAMLSPVKSINRCRRLLMQQTMDGQLAAREEIEKLKTGTLGEAISKHGGMIELEERLENGTLLTAEETARFNRILVSLSPLDQSFTRSVKSEAILHKVIREAVKVAVNLTPAELQFHEDTIHAFEKIYLARGVDPRSIGFATNMIRRMVGSCIPAMIEYFTEFLRNAELPCTGSASEDEMDDDAQLEKISLDSVSAELIETLMRQAVVLGPIDTKYDEFARLVGQIFSQIDNRRIMVFSFFVRTLKYLKMRLTADGYRVGLICGEVPVENTGTGESRYEIMEKFERGELDILLSSEVGGEGLDFQYCQAMINYDLPYNPMRVEQRIGRIDRFGQEAEKIIVASMFLAGTLDEAIYNILYDRIHLVQDSIGSLQPILGNTLVDLQKEIINGHLSKEQLEERAKQIDIALEQAKMEKETFEDSRKELMGEDYFTTPLQNLNLMTEFVSPADAAFITEVFCKEWENCDYHRIDETRGILNISKDVRGRVELFTRRPNMECSVREINPLLNKPNPVEVVFDGSIADRYRDSLFFPPCGYWTRFLLAELENAKALKKAFCLRGTPKNLQIPPGVYFVPIFEMKISGFKVELDLAAVPVNLATAKPELLEYRGFSRSIGQFSEGQPVTSNLDDLIGTDPSLHLETARQALDYFMEGHIDQLKMENAYRVEARIGSLRRGVKVRVDRLERQIQDHIARRAADGETASPEYLRIKNAQIINEQKAAEEKISELQTKRELSFALSPCAIVILFVDEEKGGR